MKGKCIIAMIILAISCGDAKKDTVEKAFSGFPGKYVVVITKSKFILEVFDRELNLVTCYVVGTGSNPDMLTKQYEGDNRTPEGVYTIREMLSADASKGTSAYRKLMMMNNIYFKRSSGYHRFGKPELDLGDNAYGPRYFEINYPNDADRDRHGRAVQEGKIPVFKGIPAGIGSGIAIHGNNDEESVGHPSSSGCLRMFNRDIVELEKYIILGTPVIILH